MSTTSSEETFGDGKISGRGTLDEHGEKSGRWEFYYRSGTLKGTGEFVDGQMHGAWTWSRKTARSCAQGTSWRASSAGNGRLMTVRASSFARQTSTSRTGKQQQENR